MRRHSRWLRLRYVVALALLAALFLALGICVDWLRGWPPLDRVAMLLLALVAYGLVGLTVCLMLAATGQRRSAGCDPLGLPDEVPPPGEHHDAAEEKKSPGRVRFESHERSIWPMRY